MARKATRTRWAPTAPPATIRESRKLLDPFSYQFFVNGVIAATLAGGLCGLVGVYIVLRHMSYIGHGLAHSVFGGAVVSHFVVFNVIFAGAAVGSVGREGLGETYLFLGAITWGFLTALAITLITRLRIIGADAAIGIITTASFALGIALISYTRSFRDFEAQLFGNILGGHIGGPGYHPGRNCGDRVGVRGLVQAVPLLGIRTGGGRLSMACPPG